MNYLKNLFLKTKKRIRRVPDRIIWSIKIRNGLKKIKLKDNSSFWDKEYVKSVVHHSHQNKLIASDFIKNIRSHQIFLNVIGKSDKILDFGCGTGEFSYFLSKTDLANKSIFVGAEISSSAVQIAKNLYKNDKLNFIVVDKNCLLIDIIGSVDLTICSQVLEHFKYPNKIIDKLFEISKYLIILVPYKQGEVDDYEEEGGAGHVSIFDEESFSAYKILDKFIFETIGWDFSNNGEKPLQLALLLEKI